MMNGEIWWIDFGLPFGSEPAKCRPAIVVQSDDFNKTEMNTTFSSMLSPCVFHRAFFVCSVSDVIKICIFTYCTIKCTINYGS